jgi:hypothetical protein
MKWSVIAADDVLQKKLVGLTDIEFDVIQVIEVEWIVEFESKKRKDQINQEYHNHRRVEEK